MDLLIHNIIQLIPGLKFGFLISLLLVRYSIVLEHYWNIGVFTSSLDSLCDFLVLSEGNFHSSMTLTT